MRYDLRELKEAACSSKPKIDPSPLPSFVGDEVFISPNIRKDIITGEKTNDHLAKAWNVPCVIGKKFICDDEHGVCSYIETLLIDLGLNDTKGSRVKKNGIDVFDYLILPLRKYHILHVQRQSEYLSEYGTPMYLEIYGRIESLGGYPEGSKDAKSLHDNHFGLGKVINVPIEIRIIDAKWSNVRNPTGISYL